MYANNLIPSLQADSIMRAYPSTTAGTHGGGHSGLSGAPEICQAIVDTLTHFCASAEYHIQTLHVPDYIKHTGGGAAALATNIEEDICDKELRPFFCAVPRGGLDPSEASERTLRVEQPSLPMVRWRDRPDRVNEDDLEGAIVQL